MDIVFLFYNDMTPLDAIGPMEVLSRLANANVKIVANKPGPITTESGLIMEAQYGIKDVSKADILLVPGGRSATTLRSEPETLEWIRKIHQTTTWTTSVCTGSLILGAAGILKGLDATSHWAVLDRLAIFGAKPISKRYVVQGKIITSAGVSAGIDMALALAEKCAGKPYAEALELTIEYDPHPPFDVGSVEKADPVLRESLRARLLSHFEKA